MIHNRQTASKKLKAHFDDIQTYIAKGLFEYVNVLKCQRLIYLYACRTSCSFSATLGESQNKATSLVCSKKSPIVRLQLSSAGFNHICFAP